jgi:hypothetical protein
MIRTATVFRAPSRQQGMETGFHSLMFLLVVLALLFATALPLLEPYVDLRVLERDLVADLAPVLEQVDDFHRNHDRLPTTMELGTVSPFTWQREGKLVAPLDSYNQEFREKSLELTFEPPGWSCSYPPLHPFVSLSSCSEDGIWQPQTIGTSIWIGVLRGVVWIGYTLVSLFALLMAGGILFGIGHNIWWAYTERSRRGRR